MNGSATLNVSRPSDREIVMSRVFNAPRALVFDAFTKPELVKRWLGPREWSLVECAIDLKVGGAYRFGFQGPDGVAMTVQGVYREVMPPARLVNTETYDDPSWGELLVTMDFVEHSGKTTLTSTVLHPSKEIRDANAGMEQGAAESYNRLDEYLASVA